METFFRGYPILMLIVSLGSLAQDSETLKGLENNKKKSRLQEAEDHCKISQGELYN